jgi:MFS family permease
VIAASVVMASGFFLLAFAVTWMMVELAAVIVGMGFGAYLSMDLALASLLLPHAQDCGKDLGLMNAAIFLPMLVAPTLAGVALGGFQSYPLLFVILAGAAVLAAGLIVLVRTVR